MLLRSLLLVTLGWFSTLSLISAEDKKAEPREKLETAITEGIRLLEAKEYTAFVKAFMSPEDLKRMTETVKVEDIAGKFGEQKAGRLLTMLKAVKDLKPTMNDKGTEATFEPKEAGDGPKKIVFIKIEKLWYIKN